MSPENQPEPDPLDDLDSETVEDLDADDAAEDVEGGSLHCHTINPTITVCLTR